MLQTVLIAGGLFALIVLGYWAVNSANPSKATQRRLAQVRYRHSENTKDKVEAQLKKAVAARKPTGRRIAGSNSRIEALELRLRRTGKSWSLAQYMYASIGIGLLVAAVVFIRSGALPLSLAIGAVVGFGIPHFMVGRAIKKRSLQFTSKFPDAIELLVRGLRSGLPVTETLAVVAQEVPGPVGQEFKTIVERIKIGTPMEDALQETADRLNTPEFSFFCITLAIQRETGGNLAETLSNLSEVLRKRAQMKLKIKAMSSESKASAYIVGALPFIVFGMMWWISPEYIGGFFTEDRLIVAGLGGLVWMSIGAFIMAKMVSFEI